MANAPYRVRLGGLPGDGGRRTTLAAMDTDDADATAGYATAHRDPGRCTGSGSGSDGDDVLELVADDAVFRVRRSTLCRVDGSAAARMFARGGGRFAAARGRVVVDRDPRALRVVVAYLRGERTAERPPDGGDGLARHVLVDAFRFYGLELAEWALYPPLRCWDEPLCEELAGGLRRLLERRDGALWHFVPPEGALDALGVLEDRGSLDRVPEDSAPLDGLAMLCERLPALASRPLAPRAPLTAALRHIEAECARWRTAGAADDRGPPSKARRRAHDDRSMLPHATEPLWRHVATSLLGAEDAVRDVAFLVRRMRALSKEAVGDPVHRRRVADLLLAPPCGEDPLFATWTLVTPRCDRDCQGHYGHVVMDSVWGVCVCAVACKEPVWAVRGFRTPAEAERRPLPEGWDEVRL